MYQSDTSSMPSGFTRRQEHDVVVEDARRFRIAARHKSIGRFDELLRAEHFRRMKTASMPTTICRRGPTGAPHRR